MQVETFARLLEPRGRDLLATIGASGDDELTLGTRLRREGHDPDLVAAAMSQVALRRRATPKLGPDAGSMYFTADALEQATRRTVATHRAARIRNHDVDSLLDLGCGIGADLVAAARTGIAVTGIDLDPLRVAMAQANLHALGLEGIAEVGDAREVDVRRAGAVFVDPARRGPRGRTFDPDAYSPPWPFVATLLESSGVVKTAPGLDHALVPDGVEAEWVSDRGDLVEACLWGRRFAGPARRATLLGSGSPATLTEVDLPADVPLGDVQEWWYEPDDAVIRAGLVTAVASQVGGTLVDPHIAYVTASRHVETPYATCFRVLAELPFREKALRHALRERDVGALTVKKRGVSVVPDQLITRLRLRGSVPATVVLTRVDGRGRALLVERA